MAFFITLKHYKFMKKSKIFNRWDFHFLKKTFRIMRITIFILITTLFQTFANESYSQKTKLSLDFSGIKLTEVLDEIENQTEFFFLFNEKLVDTDRIVTISVKDQKIEEILKELFEGTDVVYTISDRKIILAPEFLSESQQQKSVTGKVTDTKGQSLPGVTVVVKGTTTGTITNADGGFVISNVSPEATLVFSFVGMKIKEITIGNRTVLDVEMEEETIGIDEVVAIGYGTMRKKDFTGSLQTVKLQDVQAAPNSTFLESLQGVVPGLNISMSNSRPGASPEILIRGERSLSASNEPLIILDGVPFVGPINEISPADIESISILKDISASAIYGARAANGVILITSKKGSIGKLRISYTGTAGIETVERMLDMNNGPEHMKKLESVAKYINWTYAKPEDLLFQDERPQFQQGKETDWLDLIFRTGFKQDHNFSVSGGNEKATYYTSIGMLDEQGILENSSYKRYTFRSNISYHLTEWMKYTNNLQLTHNNLGGYTPGISAAIKMSPYGKLKEANGKYALYPQYPEVYNVSPFANDGATRDDLNTSIFLKQNLVVTPKFLPGLSYDLGVGMTLVNYEFGSYFPSTTVSGLTPKGLAEIRNTKYSNIIVENLLTYKKSFGKNNLEITGLYSREKFRDKGSYINASGFINDIVDYHNVQGGTNLLPQSWMNDKAIESMMGRANYNFNDVYLLTVTYRKDGYSGFGENNKFASFPSMALGYIVSNAGYFNKDNSLVNYLKLRASYGSAGNMAISPYQTLDQYRNVKYIFGDVAAGTNGFTTSVVGNPDLGWETTSSLNLGIDFSILKSRISGSVDVYKSNSTDLLMNRQVPIMNGYQNIWYNVGETSGKGVEVVLNSVNIKKEDFKWTTNLTFYLQRDKIIELRGDGVDDLANNWFIGEPLKVHYGLNSLGIFDDEADVQKWNAASYGKPGLQIIEDFSKDGQISEADRKILGRVNPDWTAGLFNKISYKRFDFGIQLYMVKGWLKSNGLTGPGTYLSEKQTNYPDIDYWTLENPTGKFLNPGADKVMVWGGDMLMDASYLRIQNINLSYTFKNVIGINDPMVTFNVKNAYTFTNWIGFDPEAADTFGPFPSQRIYTLGLNINF